METGKEITKKTGKIMEWAGKEPSRELIEETRNWARNCEEN